MVHAALWDGFPIDISSWERGMYFVQVTRNKSTRVERLIVR
ncbi:MAG: T9SS type A sorting domain-containing protein [Flavobacteriales bacterium]